MSQGYLGVIVPLYLLHVGFAAVSLGELFTVGAIVSAVLTLLVSVLADQYGRQPFLILFPLLSAVGALVFISTRNFGIIVAASAFGTIGRGVGAGYLFETASLELPFEIGTALQLLNAILFFSLFRNIRPPEEIERRNGVLPPGPFPPQDSPDAAAARGQPLER